MIDKQIKVQYITCNKIRLAEYNVNELIIMTHISTAQQVELKTCRGWFNKSWLFTWTWCTEISNKQKSSEAFILTIKLIKRRFQQVSLILNNIKP